MGMSKKREKLIFLDLLKLETKFSKKKTFIW